MSGGTTTLAPSDDASHGVDFIDILFGLVVTEIFMAFVAVTQHEYATWANLVLALIIVVFSWIGYHVAKSDAHRPYSFDLLPLTQLFVDVIIVAVYLALVKEVEHTQKVAQGVGHVISIRPEAITIAAIYGLYTMWDLLQVPMMKPDNPHLKKDWVVLKENAEAHRLRGLVALVVFAGFSAIVVFAWRPGSNASVVVTDLIYFVLLYAYRLLQKNGFRLIPKKTEKTQSSAGIGA